MSKSVTAEDVDGWELNAWNGQWKPDAHKEDWKATLDKEDGGIRVCLSTERWLGVRNARGLTIEEGKRLTEKWKRGGRIALAYR